MPYYKHETQSVLENSNYKLCYDGSTLTDQTVRNNKTNVLIIDKSIKEVNLTDVAVSNRHNLHNTLTKSSRNIQT
jgi:riboflavin synthase alpha subunit